MKINRTVRTKYNIIAGIINRIIVLFLGFIIRTFIIRYLGTEYIGLGGVITSILNVLNLAELGFTSAVVFNLYKPISEDNRDLICALLAFYRTAYRYIGMIVLVSGLTIFPFLHVFIHTDIPETVNIYVIYLIYLFNTCISYFLFGYVNVLLTAHQRNDIDSYLSALTYFVEYGIQISVLILFKSYYLFTLAMLVTTLVMNVVRYLIVRRLFPEYVCKGAVDSETRSRVYQNIKGLVIQKICASTRNTFDSIFISGYIGLIATGQYSNYYYILSSVHGILVVLNSAMSAGIGNSIAIETQEKNHNDMMKFIFIYSWLSGWCAICMLCLYQPFMKLWAGENNLLPFYDAVLFCLYFYAITLGDIRSNYSAGAGLWWYERHRSVAEVIGNIVLNALLGKTFGIPGIIVATLITILFINYFYGSTIIYRQYFTAFKVGIYFKRQGMYFALTSLVAVLTYTLSTLVYREGIIGLVEIGIIAAVIPNVFYLCVYHRTQTFKDAVALLIRTIQSR